MKSISSICVNRGIESLCIGKFDGMHIAHQKLFSHLDDKNGAVLIIDMLKPPYLTPMQEEWIPHLCYRVKIEEIKDKNCEEFSIFLKTFFPNLKKIIVGYDFRFGKNRAYTPKDLEAFFRVCIVKQVNLNGVAVHRQNILKALKNGEMSKANAMLGRIYTIQGKIVKGQGRGAKECVPTFNLKTKDCILPKSGVYATLSEVEGMRYESVSFVGHRLSSDGRFAIETHILDTQIDQKDGEIKIGFVDFIRENRKFDSFLLLKQQIQWDILKAKRILAQNSFDVF